MIFSMLMRNFFSVSISRSSQEGGVETGSMYVQYIQVISAYVPCTYYVQPLNSLKRYVHVPLEQSSNFEAV